MDTIISIQLSLGSEPGEPPPIFIEKAELSWHFGGCLGGACGGYYPTLSHSPAPEKSPDCPSLPCLSLLHLITSLVTSSLQRDHNWGVSNPAPPHPACLQGGNRPVAWKERNRLCRPPGPSTPELPRGAGTDPRFPDGLCQSWCQALHLPGPRL